ncbi:hypothetical protein BS17DRAFT_787919 [Gyrodon lividus]|nr:hypothetical protein BS17DRAFT_787919 [Gyrodon lividus]
MFQLWRLCVVFRVVRFVFPCMSFLRMTMGFAYYSDGYSPSILSTSFHLLCAVRC